MENYTKIINGVSYVETKVHDNFLKQLNEIIDEQNEEIKKLKTEIFNLKHPEQVARVRQYLL